MVYSLPSIQNGSVNYYDGVNHQQYQSNTRASLAPLIKGGLGFDTVSLSHTGRAQDAAVNSHEKILNDLEIQIQNCKRENYASEEEFQKAYKFLIEQYRDVQKSMKEADTSYTNTTTDSRAKTMDGLANIVDKAGLNNLLDILTKFS